MCLSENCQDSCLSCQNTLYFLKFRGDADCRFNRCQGLCMSISGEWHSYSNKNLNFFKEDKINICETCFRAGHCHINDCILEKSIIHNSIEAALKSNKFHYINPKLTLLKNINQNSNDYVNNMDFIMLNLNKILNLFQKYEVLYRETIKMKKIYKRLMKHITQKYKLEVSDISLNIGIDIDDDIQWRESFKDMNIYQNFFVSIKQNKINFQTGKIYLGEDINHTQTIIKNIVDFDDKIKIIIDNSKKLIQLFKNKIDENIQIIHKLMMYVDISNWTFIPRETKILILTGKRNLSESNYTELIKIANKPPEELKKIESQINSSLNKKKKMNSINNNKKNSQNNNSNLNKKNELKNNKSSDKTDLDKINEMRNKISKINSLNSNLNPIDNSNNYKMIDDAENNFTGKNIGAELKNDSHSIPLKLNEINLKNLDVSSIIFNHDDQHLSKITDNQSINNNLDLKKMIYEQKNIHLNPNIMNRINDLNNSNIKNKFNGNIQTLSGIKNITNSPINNLSLQPHKEKSIIESDIDDKFDDNESSTNISKHIITNQKNNTMSSHNEFDEIKNFIDQAKPTQLPLSYTVQNNHIGSPGFDHPANHNLDATDESYHPNNISGLLPSPGQLGLIGSPSVGINPHLLVKQTIVNINGFPEKNKNVFKPNVKTENFVKQIIGIKSTPRPFPPINLNMRINSNSTNLQSINNTNAEKEEDDEEEEEKEADKHAINLDIKNNSVSNDFNRKKNEQNSETEVKNYNSDQTKRNLDNMAKLLKSESRGHLDFPDNKLQSHSPMSLSLRKESDKNLNKEKHNHEVNNDENEEDEDEDENLSIKGKSDDLDDIDDMQIKEKKDDYTDYLFLEKKEELKKNDFLKNKFKIKAGKKKELKTGNSVLNRDIFVKEKTTELNQSNYYKGENKYTNDVKNIEDINLYEIPKEEFLKSLGVQDEKENIINKKKDVIYDDEFKLEKELYQMQHNQTLIDEIERNVSKDFKKSSIEEIKFKTKNFMKNLNKKINDYKKDLQKENLSKNEDKAIYNDIKIEKFKDNTDNIINVFNNNLKNLDEEFFEIKHNFITSLLD